jgi:hypothetical protein
MRFEVSSQKNQCKPMFILQGHGITLICYSSHRAARAVKNDIMVAISDYVKAVDSSVKTAQYGITFASNIIWLCQNLKKEPPSDVPAFMDEVGMIGNKALKQAEETRDAFNSVNRHFLQVCIQEKIFIRVRFRVVD